MLSKRLKISFSMLILCCSALFAANKDDIRLNQIGFYTYGPKTAIVVLPDAWYFSIRSTDLRETYYTSELSPRQYWSLSDDSVKVADFSQFTREGTYVVYVSGIGASHKFTISNNSSFELSKGLIRHFYYQRASTNLSSTHAGNWARSGGHYDTKVTIHSSAASVARTEGMVFSSPKGWYDAGDYGKYIVNAGISTYELLLLYEQFSDYFDTLFLNIPESGNSIPDLLDEIKWELDWVLTMQDPSDGGVYHKLTGKTFIGDLMPSDAEEERYFIGKSRTATFDFAAICAVAYRIYKKFNPSFADSCLQAAKFAYQWGKDNPKALFTKNPEGIVTGEYQDGSANDEYEWATYELFIATEEAAYYKMAIDSINTGYSIPGWQSVSMLGMYSMALTQNDSFAIGKVIGVADGLLKTISSHPFRTSAKNLYWGSNGVVANEGMAMLVAFLITKDCKYLEGAIHSLDYILGRNGTGYCFVTGFGTKSPINPHHRPSTADGINKPVPGFLVGGPNRSATVSECPSANYPIPDAKKWVDMNCSYSTNEIAINWNAPAAFLAGGIEAIFNSSKFDIQNLIDKYQIDSEPPKPATIDVTDICADHATISWKSEEKTSVTIQYSTDSLMKSSEKTFCSYSDSNQITLTGLLPDNRYFLKIIYTDNSGNISSGNSSFATAVSSIFSRELFGHTIGTYSPGNDLSVSIKNVTGVVTKLIYSVGGSAITDTLICSENNGEYSTKVPGSKVTETGVVYSIFLQKDDEYVRTQEWSVAPDSIQLTKAMLSLPGTYSLISFPSCFLPMSSIAALSPALGDTSSWRFYGYDQTNRSYLPFDTLESGIGGWLYCKEGKEVSVNGRGIKPDSLFPIVLGEGWNCIGNPFPFPIFWNNSLISNGSALIGITDSISDLFLRHQIFLYKDTTANRKNDGVYLTNRELISHNFDDSLKLNPWEACWVYSEKDSVKLLLNPSVKLNSRLKLQKRKRSNDRSWFYKISAKSAGYMGHMAVIGAASGARDGYDGYDSPKPPSISSELQIGFLHPEWNKYQGMYASDIISYTGLHNWTLSVKDSGTDPITITWERSGSLEGYIYMKDLKTGNVVDITSIESYTYNPAENETDRSFLISWMPNKQSLSQSKPEVWSLSQDRIGSMQSLMKFKYTVPSSIFGKTFHTVIEVFDINGRCVKQLVNESKLAGFYTVNWDGRNISGTSVASGLYVVRLNSAAFSKSIGVHLVH